mmetsp:Transcript_47771/g.132798  ORF Transcript_47771/g.132798 Transcript_47771/m.132798 type:complete len:204 (-) Transcript_47771:1575-2186(-)
MPYIPRRRTHKAGHAERRTRGGWRGMGETGETGGGNKVVADLPYCAPHLCFSIYSDMSIRVIGTVGSNTKLERAFANSVLPTPVGPKNKKTPFGRSFDAPRPVRLSRTLSDIALSTWSCPTTLLTRSVSKFNRAVVLSPLSFASGIPVCALMTSAIISSVTTSCSIELALMSFSFALFSGESSTSTSSSSAGIFDQRSSPAFS